MKPLQVPDAEPAKFAKNFIRLSVCELRFPTLLELETRAPVPFQKALRHEYPTYERATDVNFNPGQGVTRNAAHRFVSKKGRWTVSLRQASLSLETPSYESFELFSKRLEFVVSAALETIDSNFFTRIGLRYINALPTPQDQLEGWLNPSLARPLADGTYGTVTQLLEQVQGSTDMGGYIFRHGTSLNHANGLSEYMVDLDFFAENVEASETISVVTQLHRRAYSLFSWTLGPKARAYLGPSQR